MSAVSDLMMVAWSPIGMLVLLLTVEPALAVSVGAQMVLLATVSAMPIVMVAAAATAIVVLWSVGGDAHHQHDKNKLHRYRIG